MGHKGMMIPFHALLPFSHLSILEFSINDINFNCFFIFIYSFSVLLLFVIFTMQVSKNVKLGQKRNKKYYSSKNAY